MNWPPVGTLHTARHPPATVDAAGVWHCPDDHEWEDLLNDQFGAGAELPGPSVLTRGVRALHTAQAKTPGSDFRAEPEDPLPAHVIS